MSGRKIRKGLLQGITKEEQEQFMKIAGKMLHNLESNIKYKLVERNTQIMNETNLMSKMKISKAVATMAIPSVISSLVTVVTTWQTPSS